MTEMRDAVTFMCIFLDFKSSARYNGSRRPGSYSLSPLLLRAEILLRFYLQSWTKVVETLPEKDLFP